MLRVDIRRFKGDSSWDVIASRAWSICLFNSNALGRLGESKFRTGVLVRKRERIRARVWSFHFLRFSVPALHRVHWQTCGHCSVVALVCSRSWHVSCKALQSALVSKLSSHLLLSTFNRLGWNRVGLHSWRDNFAFH